MPVRGDRLPIILLSHGHGGATFLSSLYGYAPLADFWAARGFVVIQPTHLDSSLLDLRDEPLPDAPLFWRDRADDLRVVLDRLVELKATVAGSTGRWDGDQVVAVGHSMGGNTVTLLAGARVLDPDDDRDTDLRDPRIRAVVAIAPPGIADEHAGPWVRDRYRALRHIDVSAMTGAALVIAGDDDLNPNFSDRLSYRWDAYTHSPAGNKTLARFAGAGHILGGISGYDCAEADDLDPHRVATVRAVVWAYLRSRLDPADPAWSDALAALETKDRSPVRIETR